MKRKRKVVYAPKKQKGTPAPDGSAISRPSTVVAINLRAGVGRADIAVGSRVTILGDGMYAGEAAVVERLITGGIPAALVRTEAGGTRRVRTIDLEPIRSRSQESAAG